MAEDLCFTPRAALQHVLKSERAGNAGQNHVGRDVLALRRAGIEPRKVAGRWVVPRGELERWASGQVQPSPESASQAKRRPGRPRKNGRPDVQTQKGNGGAL